MQVAPAIRFEEARFAALQACELDAAEAGPAVLHLVDFAARLFSVPCAFVSLIERDRQVFYATAGVDLCASSREASFCSHAIAGDDVLVVLDARLDLRFTDNPFVVGAPNIRFYAGAPIRSPSGHALGTLSIFDRRSRKAFSDEDRRHLDGLAAVVADLFEARRLDVARRNSQFRFEGIASTSPDGIVCADDAGRITVWNDAAARLFGHTSEEALGSSIDIIVPPRMAGGHVGGLKRIADAGAPRLIGRTIELSGRHKDGTEFPIELSLSTWSEDGRAAFGSIVRDMRERRALEERLRHLAHHDALTGLPNRGLLCERIAEAGTGNGGAAVLVVDLDGFKEINDTLGHSAGDRILRMTARRLLDCVPPCGTVARLGGDEFAIVIPNALLEEPMVLAAAIVEAMARAFQVDDDVLNLGASVGVASSTARGETADELLSRADLALYRAKADGRHRFHVFTPDLMRTALERRASRESLHRATGNGEFTLFYQPQIRLEDGALVGAEALLRWHHPERGLIGPAGFIAVLEESRYANEVGDWVLRRACLQAAEWRALLPEFRIGVNLFAAQCRAGDLSARVFAMLSEANLPVSALELEITENIILRQNDAQLRAFRELRKAGVGVAFDDYGTGYASLSQLKAFPLTRLKIDQSFVRGMCVSRQDAAIVRAILDLSRSFGLDVIAEGVETAEQHRRLLKKGCTQAQGFLYAPPLSSDDFAAKYGLSVQVHAGSTAA